ASFSSLSLSLHPLPASLPAPSLLPSLPSLLPSSLSPFLPSPLLSPSLLPSCLSSLPKLECSCTVIIVHCSLELLEIEKIQKGDSKKEDEENYLDLFSHKNMKLKERVLIPVKQYPKEEELRKGGDPKYAHLNMDLHVFIEVFGPPCEAYALMAHAMEEVKKFLVPDMMDDICQEQFLELSYLNGVPEPSRGRGVPVRGRGAAPPPPPVPRGRGVGPPRGALVRGTPVRGAITRGATVTRGVPPPPTVRGAPAPRARTAGIQRIPLPPPPAPETYEEYGYDDTYAEQSYEGYEGYYSQSQGDSEYYDYGHGEVQDSYEAYGQDDWNGTRPSLKAPPARPVKGAYREHPYGRY
uniref:KH RNA binding domain containing, signal transduction associated 1 n=1 Tax=Nomascus leucogenys TaxID=61853 RepID=A0A2I3HPP1_NOMLE